MEKPILFHLWETSVNNLSFQSIKQNHNLASTEIAHRSPKFCIQINDHLVYRA